MEDNVLIESFLRGKKECFDILVSRYKGLVFNVCFQMLGSYEEALDTSQEIFLKLYDSLRNFRQQAKFSTYLYRISMNFCKNRLKSLARRGKKHAFSIDEPVKMGDDLIKREIPDPGPNPRDIAHSNKIQDAVQEAIDQLQDEYRQILILREMQGLTYEELAEVLDIDMGTVKSRLSRARQALKQRVRGIL